MTDDTLEVVRNLEHLRQAARLLCLSARVLNDKIKQFGITHPGCKQFT